MLLPRRAAFGAGRAAPPDLGRGVRLMWRDRVVASSRRPSSTAPQKPLEYHQPQPHAGATATATATATAPAPATTFAEAAPAATRTTVGAEAEAEAGAPTSLRHTSTLRTWARLVKLQLSAMVVFTSGAGFLVAGAPYAVDSFVAVTAGTSLAAASASAFNQLYERRTDALMRRTAHRPLPAGLV